MRATPVLLALVLTTAGCGSGDAGSALPPATTPAASTPAPAASPSTVPSAAASALAGPVSAAQRCVAEQQGYALSFPADWHVATGGGVDECSFFDPEPLELEPGTEADGVAVRVDVLDRPYAEARPAVQDDGPVEDVRDTRVAGRSAVRITGRTSGEDLLPPGLRTTTWLVDLGRTTLLATTVDVERVDYDRAVQVLDALAASVEPV